MNDIFASGGVLAKALPGYHERPGQTLMARAVESVFNTGGQLLVEAGCGVGKSYGYLVPAIHIARAKKLHVVVATATIALQEQLVRKDLPFLKKHLGVPFSYELLKGRSNFLCHAKFVPFAASYEKFVQPGDWGQAKAVALWAHETQTGDKSELPFAPAFWSEVSATSEECRGRRCQFYRERCWAQKARVRAAAADIIVTNYHLLLTAGGVAVPQHEVLVCDEAHELADTAREKLGWTIKRTSFERFARWVLDMSGDRLDSEGNPLDGPPAGRASDVSEAFHQHEIGRPHVFAGDMRKAAVDLMNILDGVRAHHGETLRITRPGEFTKFVLDKPCELLSKVARAAGELAETWQDAVEECYDDDLAGAADAAGRVSSAADAMIAQLQLLGDPRKAPNTVVWIQENKPKGYGSTRPGRGSWPSVEGRALDVSTTLRRRFARLHASVLTSATLAIGDDFDFVRSDVGALENAHELIVPSPFQFKHKAVCIIPERIPVPPRKYEYETNDEFNAAERAWRASVADHALALVKLCGGRCLLLFSSRAAMQACRIDLLARLPGLVPGVTVMTQDDAPVPELLRRFKENPHSVLLGLASLRQGVDIPGDTCVGVMIDRLPFPVPTEPLEAALSDMLKAQGKHPFGARSLPCATIALRQGFGRLIRTENDVGIVVIADTRLIHTEDFKYGWRVLKALPDVPKARTFKSAYKVAPKVFARIAKLSRPAAPAEPVATAEPSPV